MGIVVLPFFLMGVGAVLAIFDVATMGSSHSAMGNGSARGAYDSDALARSRELPASSALPPTYRSGQV